MSDHLGIPIASTSCSKVGYIYHPAMGISSFWNRFDPETTSYDGSLVPFKDHDLLHELLHALVADPWQLQYPEYALDLGIVGHGADGPFVKDHLLPDPYDVTDYWSGLVPDFFQQAQEVATWRLACKLGPAWGIHPELTYFETLDIRIDSSWKVYRNFKLKQELAVFTACPSGWQMKEYIERLVRRALRRLP